MPDLIENYMDYAREDCMNMFTHGQVTLMRNVLMGPRVGLLSPPSSVNDERNAFTMAVYPNPTSGSVKLSIEGMIASKGELSVIDFRGIPVMNQALAEISTQHYNTTLETNRLAPGMYFLQVRTSNGIMTEKLIVH